MLAFVMDYELIKHALMSIGGIRNYFGVRGA